MTISQQFHISILDPGIPVINQEIMEVVDDSTGREMINLTFTWDVSYLFTEYISVELST